MKERRANASTNSKTAVAAAAMPFNSHLRTHLSPPLPPSSPSVWNWKIKQRLATMKEEGDKLKNQEQTSTSTSTSTSGEGLEPLSGEKVISLDENLPDGALEAYWAQLRREREGQGGGGGGGGGGEEEKKEEGGKAKRKMIKVCGGKAGGREGGRAVG